MSLNTLFAANAATTTVAQGADNTHSAFKVIYRDAFIKVSTSTDRYTRLVEDANAYLKEYANKFILGFKGIKVEHLTVYHFSKMRSVINKYFRTNSGATSDRIRIPDLTAEEYEYALTRISGYDKLVKENSANLKFDTASTYFINKVKLDILSRECGIKNLDGRTYNFNLSKYVMPTYFEQVDYESELFIEQEQVILEPGRTSFISLELVEDLERMVLKAVRKRLIMLLDLEKVSTMLKLVREYTGGYHTNPTDMMIATLELYKREIYDLFVDRQGGPEQDVSAFVANNNDLTLFAVASPADYIRTYQSVLRSMGFSNKDWDEEFIRNIMGDIDDPYLDSIVSFDAQYGDDILDYEDDDTDDYNNVG